MNKNYNFIVKVTTGCPGNCKCCKDRQENFKYKSDSKKIFDKNVFEKICLNIRKLGGTYICLSGGEPTMIPNVDEYIIIANKYGLATRINTNGWNVTKENLEKWLNNGLDQIVLSIYGIDEEKIIKTRGNRLIYERSIRALEAIKELKKKYKFIFILQTIIMKDTYKEMDKILNLAIDYEANLFWPSYLEDAINLPDIRMNKSEIKDFKNNVIPKMKNVILTKKFNNNLTRKLLNSLDKYYNDDIKNYIYHEEDVNCHWAGYHFTFYPNGIIDPCPGHEYFKSDYQYKIDYKEIDNFMKIENLQKAKHICFDYCKYCPQGKHHEISFMDDDFNEHDSKENLK